jgi:hypothetical protein
MYGEACTKDAVEIDAALQTALKKRRKEILWESSVSSSLIILHSAAARDYFIF